MRGKKILFLLYFFCFFSLHSFSQPYGNEWINYSQKYFKIPVLRNGICRINRSVLESAGAPVTQPDFFQIFTRGEEQYIYVKTNLGMVDYIEFFTEKNSGWLDTALYDSAAYQANPYFSLINDTSSYFLTWNTSFTNRRMISENDTLFTSYTPAMYCLYELIQSFSSRYYAVGSHPFYSEGEGWFDASFGLGVTVTKNISALNAYTGGPPTEIEFAVVGESNSSGTDGKNHHLSVTFLTNKYLDTLFSGYKIIRKTFSVSSFLLNTSPVSFNFSSVNDLNAPADRMAVSFIRMRYPHTFDFENNKTFRFILPNSSQTKALINITGFDSGSKNPVLYDLANHKRIKVVKNGSSFSALIPNAAISEKDCFLASESSVISIESLPPVQSMVSENGYFTNYGDTEKETDYIIITHPKLWEKALSYKNYRNATGYKVAMINIEELYDQFGYGIRKHPLSIRNFINYVIHTWDTIPKNLFLIGKSVHAREFRFDTISYSLNLVPSVGEPSSDVLLTAGLNGTLYDPPIPLGRLSAQTDDQISWYLQKVKDYEQAYDTTGWTKYILHFGGGSDEFEQTLFANYLNNYRKIIEDTLFGGKVVTFLKNNSLPMQITQSESIRNLINAGTSMLTFFGHGTVTGFDQDIDDPASFNNKGKYPFILANSCYSGDIHHAFNISKSEEWVIQQDKGSIGFLAVVDLGYSSQLNGYSTELYKNISYKSYGQPLGKMIQRTIQSYQNATNSTIVSTCLQFTLHGDPAVVIHSHEKPDLKIGVKDISFTPSVISSDNEYFDLNIIITNLGRAFNDTFVVEINRVFPDNSYSDTTRIKIGCLYKDTLQVKLPVDAVKGHGMNRFHIMVDALNQIDELSEINNSASVIMIIHSDDISPVYPYKYAIYPNPAVTLKASTSNIFASSEQYLFEMDTTDTFNSPFKKTGSVTHQGGIVSWSPPLTLQDSMVYYWRVSKFNPDPDKIKWKESSFIYIPGKTGWSQAHFFQFKEDNYYLMNYNRPDRRFDFIITPKELTCHNIGFPGINEYSYIEYDIDGSGDNGCCGASYAMIAVIIDSSTLIPWKSDQSDYGHRNYPKCPSRIRPDNYFVFNSDSTGRVSLINLLKTQVDDGNYILIYTFRNGDFSHWLESELQYFDGLGAQKLRSIQNDNTPYIFFTKKGQLSSTLEQVGENSTSEIELKVPIKTNFNYGQMTSVLIGPSNKWQTLHWKQHSLENPLTDSVKLKITGIKTDETEHVVWDDIPSGLLYINNLSDSIDASVYPYIKMNLYTQDYSYKTPAQLDRWQITFEGIPETALNPSAGSFFYKDTVQEGEEIIFAIATENISPYDMDSLLISYLVKDKNNAIHKIKSKRTRLHPKYDILIDTLHFQTTGYTGLNSLWMEVNPLNETTGKYDQPEQYHFNNVAQKYFYVTSDKTNPLLDVTFDGVHILNGDIVSAKPHITVRLADENKHLPLNDTALFKIYLKPGNSSVEKRIYFSDNSGDNLLQWIPAQLPDNRFEIIYSPVFTEDGTYELRIQAKDVSNNESGSFDYKISFRIVTKSTITNVFNYPNPFSTSTRFVFELTGMEIPTDMRIQIMTVTGKLVREISLNELGNIHIGRNITQYAWDGKDDFGDQLANGVYFFRVIASINGQSIEKRTTEADSYFTKEFGKMYLMR